MSDTNESDNESENMISDADIEMSINFDSEDKRKTKEEFEYEVLTIDQIAQQMQECIEQIRSVLHLSSATIRTLLKHFKWDIQKLLEQICDEDLEQLFNSIGIVGNKEQIQTKRRRVCDDTSTDNCRICFQVVESTQMFDLDCGHQYCRNCWNQYLTTKIMSEGNVTAITCAQTDCNVVVDDDQTLQLITDPRVRNKYHRLTTNSYVESNRLLRWCPKPDCMHIFSVKTREEQPVRCVCGTEVCFGCGEPNHEPIACDFLREWNKKSAGNNVERIDGKTANWIITNTKECPKCQTSIEKNGGCNHMTCRSIKCKYEFCWVCLESWSTHGTSYYNCNLYNESKVKTIKDSQSEQRKALERFMFYWTRFMNHKQSLKFESELKSTVKTRMAQMQQKLGMAWVEVQFMEQAVDVLCRCRQTLMYTYVFAHYNQRTQQLNIFEENQRDLQKAVETLSEYLEVESDTEEDKDIRSKVLHSTNYCQNRRKALIDHIAEGNDSECWKYSFN